MSDIKKDYNVKIITSSENISARDKIKMLRNDDAVLLSEDKIGEEFPVKVVKYVILAIHNEKAKDGNNKDYNNLVMVDEDGNKYLTGSPSAITAFTEIVETICNEPDEVKEEILSDLRVRFVTRPSNNFKGKNFITCVLD